MTVDMIQQDDSGVFIERRRSKTGVLCRWALWAETVKMLQDEISRRKEKPKAGEPLLLSRDGLPLVRFAGDTKLDAIWQAWFKTMAKLPAATRFAFKDLRKVSSQIVRDIGGKELSEVFLAHADGGVGEHYTGFQDWDKLADATGKLRDRLSPVFAGK